MRLERSPEARLGAWRPHCQSTVRAAAGERTRDMHTHARRRSSAGCRPACLPPTQQGSRQAGWARRLRKPALHSWQQAGPASWGAHAGRLFRLGRRQARFELARRPGPRRPCRRRPRWRRARARPCNRGPRLGAWRRPGGAAGADGADVRGIRAVEAVQRRAGEHGRRRQRARPAGGAKRRRARECRARRLRPRLMLPRCTGPRRRRGARARRPRAHPAPGVQRGRPWRGELFERRAPGRGRGRGGKSCAGSLRRWPALAGRRGGGERLPQRRQRGRERARREAAHVGGPRRQHQPRRGRRLGGAPPVRRQARAVLRLATGRGRGRGAHRHVHACAPRGVAHGCMFKAGCMQRRQRRRMSHPHAREQGVRSAGACSRAPQQAASRQAQCGAVPVAMPPTAASEGGYASLQAHGRGVTDAGRQGARRGGAPSGAADALGVPYRRRSGGSEPPRCRYGGGSGAGVPGASSPCDATSCPDPDPAPRAAPAGEAAATSACHCAVGGGTRAPARLGTTRIAPCRTDECTGGAGRSGSSATEGCSPAGCPARPSAAAAALSVATRKRRGSTRSSAISGICAHGSGRGRPLDSRGRPDSTQSRFIG